MRLLSSVTIRRVFGLAIVGLIAGLTTSAHAVPPQQAFRRIDTQTFTGKCCKSWGETVSVVQPAKVQPVVVSWSTDILLELGTNILVGLIVNDGPCQFYGGGSLDQNEWNPGFEPWDAKTMQFIVPVSQMHSGTNTFTVCGGGLASDSDTVNIGFNVLEVRLAK